MLIPIFAVLSFAIPFALALSYPLALLLYLPKSTHPSRWIQNNPSISVFLLSSFPIAVCVFSISMMQDGILRHWFSGWHVWVSYPAIVVTILVVTLIVFDDFTRRPIAPYTLKKRAAEEAARLEKQLRAEYRNPNKHFEGKRKEYQKLVKLGTLKAIWTRGGPIAYIHLALTWLAALFTLTYFWYLVAASQFITPAGIPLGDPSKNKLVLVYILLLTWFPLRLHTEWYQNYFHNKDWLKGYPAFWLLAFLAFAVLVLIILIVKPGGAIKFLSVLNVVFVAALGAIGKLKPDWLRAVADFLQSTSFVYFLAIYLIFLVLVAAVTAAVWVNS
jgi:hypothetical protein